MLQILLKIGAVVQVPASDVTDGKASPGLVVVQASGAQTPAALNILSGDAPPRDAFVAVPYQGRWFWIGNTDIRSKSTFVLVMMLFSISETGVRGAAPVVTVPTN